MTSLGVYLALGATMYVFDIRLADADRNVYETLALRVARHPSETAEYLLTRVLAYCLEFTEGIAFSKGLSSPEEPAIAVRDLTGALQSWIDIGQPEAARVHKAAKAAPHVAIYTHKDAEALIAQLASEKIYRAESVKIHGVDRGLLGELTAKLERRMEFDLSVSEGTVYLSLGEDTLTGTIEQLQITKSRS